jgi:hypothetical protein
LPIREAATVSQLGQVRLEPGLWQRFLKHLIVAPMQRYGVIPDLARYVDCSLEMPQPLRPKKLELEGTAHLGGLQLSVE